MRYPSMKKPESSKKRMKSRVVTSSSSVRSWSGRIAKRRTIAMTQPTKIRKLKNSRKKSRKGRTAPVSNSRAKEKKETVWLNSTRYPVVNPLIISTAKVATMKRELGMIPSREEVVAVLKEKFEQRVGKTTPASLNPEILEKMGQIEAWMTSEEFLLKRTPRIPTGVKIRGGVEVVYGLHKARGGLIRATEAVTEERIEDITISGDFTFFPKEQLIGLEESLEKVPLEEERITETVETFYEGREIESPGVESKDMAQTILNPIKPSKK